MSEENDLGLMEQRTRAIAALQDDFGAWAEKRRALDAILAERKAKTGPLYAKKNAIEKEFKPSVDEAKLYEARTRDFVEAKAQYAYTLGGFGTDDEGNPVARYTFGDGSWAQVEKEKIDLEVTDWRALLLNETLLETFVSSVKVELNQVAVAMAEIGKEIPGVKVHKHRPVKLHLEPQEDTAKEA